MAILFEAARGNLLTQRLPAAALHGVNPGQLTGSPKVIAALPPAVHEPVVSSFVSALNRWSPRYRSELSAHLGSHPNHNVEGRPPSVTIASVTIGDCSG